MLYPHLDSYEPKQVLHPEAVGFYQYTLNGDAHNSGSRLQRVADSVGMAIVASDFMGQNTRTIFDLKAKQALVPGNNFETTSRRAAEWLLPQLGIIHTD